MKKILTVTVAFLMMFTLVALQVNAGPNCGSRTGLTSSKADLASSKADLVGYNKANCSKFSQKACMAQFGMSVEECKAMCKELGGKFELTQISVKGMTCGGCEKSVTAALGDVPGVVKVIKVSYTDGTALVAIDPAKNTSEFLTKAVADQGFSAEIIPAVARFDGTGAKSKLTNSDFNHCSKFSSKASGKSCGARGSRGIEATTASATSSETKVSNSSSGGTK